MWYVVFIFILVLVIFGVIFTIEYNKVKNSKEILGEGLILLRNGNYDAGLAKCNQMDYSKSVCYSTLLGLKMGRNETVSSNICEGLVLDTPFWERGDSQAIQLIKNTCECMVRYNDKERCTNFN